MGQILRMSNNEAGPRMVMVADCSVFLLHLHCYTYSDSVSELLLLVLVSDSDTDGPFSSHSHGQFCRNLLWNLLHNIFVTSIKKNTGHSSNEKKKKKKKERKKSPATSSSPSPISFFIHHCFQHLIVVLYLDKWDYPTICMLCFVLIIYIK